MKKIAVLGSTGSIGAQTLEVIAENRDRFAVTALSCDKNIDLLEKQIRLFQPGLAVTSSEADALELSARHPRTEFLFGEEGLREAARSDCGMVVNALVGAVGLLPTYDAVLAGKDIALANKESLVAGGGVIMPAMKGRENRMLPVDSEHSAIFQCLAGGGDPREARRLILTASGGPFRGYSIERLQKVTLEEALRHPNWSMGRKITVDSATMMNKGLEIIEAKWLFGFPESSIDVVVHPQSIVHSMVEYRDGAVIAQLGEPDMKAPIRYALAWPERLEAGGAPLDFFGKASRLTFEEPDAGTFICLRLARQAIQEEGSSYPIVLNAANEALVQLFLEKRIGFLDIQLGIEKTLSAHKPEYHLEIGRVLEIDKEIRQETLRWAAG